jgi:hypothetical protein
MILVVIGTGSVRGQESEIREALSERDLGSLHDVVRKAVLAAKLQEREPIREERREAREERRDALSDRDLGSVHDVVRKAVLAAKLQEREPSR